MFLFSHLGEKTFHEWYACLRKVGYNATFPIMHQNYSYGVTERFYFARGIFIALGIFKNA